MKCGEGWRGAIKVFKVFYYLRLPRGRDADSICYHCANTAVATMPGRQTEVGIKERN